jgi:hypothetical protein
MTHMKKAPLLPLLVLTACTTPEQQKLHGFLSTPEGQAIKNIALGAATAAAQDYSDTGKVHGNAVATAAISAASQGLRTLQSTGDAARPAAITEVVHTQADNTSIARRIAPAVAAAIAHAVRNGASPYAANEAAALGLDQAAATKP